MNRPIRISDPDSATDVRSGVPLTNLLTHSRTNGESWLSPREILTFRNARAHMPECLALVRSRMDGEAAS